MLHLKAAPWHVSLRQFIRVELAMAHIDGCELFPWDNPCGGGLMGISHMYSLYVLTEYSKAVLSK